MPDVKKAVIAAAGLGTRMYPVTKVVDKAMLPIGRRPVIDYIGRECLAAGVEDIAIVVRKGSSQVQAHYSDDGDLVTLLKRRGWEKKGDLLREIPRVPRLVFIEQDLAGEHYGTAVPALLAREFVDDDRFYFVSGDDILIDPDGESSLANLEVASNGGAAIVGQPMRAGVHGAYGHLATRATSRGLHLTGLIEKPDDATVLQGGALVNISRYLLSGAFLDMLADVGVHRQSGELRVTDGLCTLIQHGFDVFVSKSAGRYFDIGSADGLAEAWGYVMS